MQKELVIYLETPVRDSTEPWPWWLYLLFAIIGPIVLSVAWAEEFEGGKAWFYPFVLPVWSWTVTIVKVVVMFGWVTSRSRARASARGARRIIAAIFLIGALHALLAAGANLIFACMAPVAALSVGCAAMSGVFYLHAYCEIRPTSNGRKFGTFDLVLAWALLAAVVLGTANTAIFEFWGMK